MRHKTQTQEFFMIAPRRYRWFLHPLDKLTNEVFCKQFNVSDVNSSDRLKNPVEVVMSDGKKKDTLI